MTLLQAAKTVMARWDNGDVEPNGTLGTCNDFHALDTAISAEEAREDELAKLKAIVDRLPKTADDVVIVPGMELYQPWMTALDGIATITVSEWYDETDDSPVDPRDVYSTRALAVAAKEGSNDADQTTRTA